MEKKYDKKVKPNNLTKVFLHFSTEININLAYIEKCFTVMTCTLYNCTIVVHVH